MLWLYHLGRIVVIVFFRLFTRWRVEGRENVPPKGAVLVVSNHVHTVDPPLVCVSLGRQVIFMAKDELFRSRLQAFCLRCLGAFPVRRGQLDREAMRRSVGALKEGKPLVMFPEATRNPKARLQRALPGSALIASRHGVPVLPVGISGIEELKWLRFWRRPRITVKIGPLFYLNSAGARASKEELAEQTELLMRRIAELLPPEYRGVYGESQP